MPTILGSVQHERTVYGRSALGAEMQQRIADIREIETDESAVAQTLLDSLVTNAEPRDREEWAAKAKARAAERYGRPQSA